VKNACWICFLIFASVLSFVACNGSGSGSEGGGGAGAGANPPLLTGTNPAANNTSVLSGSLIATTFDKNMKAASADTFVVYGNQTGKKTGLYTGGGSQTLVFNPDNAFKVGEILEIILTSSLTATDGAALASPVVYRFWSEALAGTGVFTAGNTIAPQSGATGLAVGDWDGDGDNDLAVANFSNSTVVILRNDPLGDFSASDTVNSQSGASALAALDWDGDGDLDLAVANDGGSTVSLLQNNGSGNFSSVSAVIGQANARALAAGDWDGDGDLDLAVANFGASEVAILENFGSGTFADVEAIGGLSGASALASGDWDGDGDLDLAVANRSGNSVVVLENDGDGGFSGGNTSESQSGATSLAVGDWDGDGDLDLAVANATAGTGEVAILQNDGTGVFTDIAAVTGMTGASAVVAGDWYGDGDLDLAVANATAGAGEVAILQNDGTGAFTNIAAVTGMTGASGLAAGDWDNNNTLDLAVANFGADNVTTLANTP
jgi:hypothetical protein